MSESKGSFQKKTKILYLITKSSWGGAQQYVYDLATQLDQDLFESKVALGGNGELVEKLRSAHIPIVHVNGLQRDMSILNDIYSFLSIAKILMTERPDILHINSTKAGALGVFLGRFFFIKKILFTAHGWAFNEDRPLWQKIIIKTVHWITVLLSHKTIVVSNGTRAQMDWPLVQNRMHVIHLGRTLHKMEHKEHARGIIETKIIDSTAYLSEFHTDFWIGTIAELHPIKRLNRAIDAMASLTKEFPILRFIIIHDGHLKQKLQQQVRDLGLQEHVFFTGIIENASRLLPAFDLFVLPSKSEAFGYVLLEAGQASVPVIATNVGGIPDIITHQENGLLVPPDDTPALTAALRTLITNKHMRDKLAQSHFQKSSQFPLEKMIRETVKIYNK